MKKITLKGYKDMPTGTPIQVGDKLWFKNLKTFSLDWQETNTAWPSNDAEILFRPISAIKSGKR